MQDHFGSGHAHDHDHAGVGKQGHEGHGHSHAPASFGRAFAIGTVLNMGVVIIKAGYGFVSPAPG